MPDLRSLPAWGINIAENGNFLRFSATVWNAGNSPLVVDGFRHDDEDEMTAYQYFFDGDGNQTGYQQVGHMHWDTKPSHQHWHFEDFARYSLLNEDMDEAVRSRKEAFCLANTDAVDSPSPTRSGSRRTPTSRPRAVTTRRCRSARCWRRAGVTPTRSTAPASPSASRACPTAPTTSRCSPTRRTGSSSPSLDNNLELRKIRISGKAPGDRAGSGVPQVGIIDGAATAGLRR